MNELIALFKLIAALLCLLAVIVTPVALWGRSKRAKRNIPWGLALAEVIDLFEDADQSGMRLRFTGKTSDFSCTIVDQLEKVDIKFSWSTPKGFQGSLVTIRPPVRHTLSNLLSFGLSNIPKGPNTDTENVSFNQNFRTTTHNQGVLFYLKPKEHTLLNTLALQSSGLELSRSELFLTTDSIEKIPSIVNTSVEFLKHWDS